MATATLAASSVALIPCAASTVSTIRFLASSEVIIHHVKDAPPGERGVCRAGLRESLCLFVRLRKQDVCQLPFKIGKCRINGVIAEVMMIPFAGVWIAAS